MPRAIPHGFTVSDAGPGRIIIVASPGGFDQFVAAAGEPAPDLRMPQTAAPASPASPPPTASRSCPGRTLTTQARHPRGCPYQELRAVPPDLRASTANQQDGHNHSERRISRVKPCTVRDEGVCRHSPPDRIGAACRQRMRAAGQVRGTRGPCMLPGGSPSLTGLPGVIQAILGKGAGHRCLYPGVLPAFGRGRDGRSC
jgi:hypothetical protein